MITLIGKVSTVSTNQTTAATVEPLECTYVAYYFIHTTSSWMRDLLCTFIPSFKYSLFYLIDSNEHILLTCAYTITLHNLKPADHILEDRVHEWK